MPSLIDLTGMMKGKDCLSGWDVLVAYNQTQLNALLAERASKLKFSDPIEYLTEYVGKFAVFIDSYSRYKLIEFRR